MRRMRAGLIAAGLIFIAGCASSPHDRLLQLPEGSELKAKQHNADGIREFQSGSWTQAKHHFELAMMADPNVAQTHYNLGLVLYRLGKGVAAEQHFIEASKLAPKDPVISNFRTLYKAPKPTITPPQERPKGRGSRDGGDGHGVYSHHHSLPEVGKDMHLKEALDKPFYPGIASPCFVSHNSVNRVIPKGIKKGRGCESLTVPPL